MGRHGPASVEESDVASPFKRGTLKDECYRLLIKAGPNGLKVNELVKGIREAQVAHLAGSTPANTVCSALSSGAGVFERIAPGTYALTAAAAAAVKETTQRSKKREKAKPPSSSSISGPKRMRRLDSLDSLPSCATSDKTPGASDGGGDVLSGAVGGEKSVYSGPEKLEAPSPPRTPLCDPRPAPTPSTTTSTAPAAARPRPPRRSSLAKIYKMSGEFTAANAGKDTTANTSGRGGPAGDGAPASAPASAPSSAPRQRWLSQRDACLEVLSEAGPEGMTVNEVVDAIKRRSLARLDGRTPHNSITRCLSADDSFIRLQPGRYAMHDTRMAMCAEVLSLFSATSADHPEAAAGDFKEAEGSCQREADEGTERDEHVQQQWTCCVLNGQSPEQRTWVTTQEHEQTGVEVEDQDFEMGPGDDASEVGDSSGSFKDSR
mmetsp:Transcript_23725/g.45180  ORF Transcript_23725/g.45180 Transcript_23725/m.45180 type:complete len:434 (-) Transcript_23725:156-1457(-)|eukprot:CAMPEP_0114306698 /NCGR_PEP_ID=MMETSP0059-20121206/17043_1 /TAXON_ID=36894 /ORGANISM="Pyramimonas parkeae, Strain CCMP726" /LENGTH=433 /DNA_ID=CAMNT_0001430049 /DNA_START=118 /DNA_END=1419 /DNA_ORIENTATION=-